MEKKLDIYAILTKIADAEGVTLQDVCAEMQQALDAAFENPETDDHPLWVRLGEKKERPSVEEFIKAASELLEERMTK